MPIYELRCLECGAEIESWAPITVGKSSTSCSCGGLARRVYTPPAMVNGFQAHFNHSIGRFVNNEREFRDALKQGSEEASARMGGMAVNYEPVPIAEVAHSQEGLDHPRWDRARKEGKLK